MNFFLKINNHPLFTKGLVFADQAMVSGSNFILGILLVRWMGLEEYGVFALLWMGVLFALGINHAFVSKPLLSIAPQLEANKKQAYFKGLHTIQIFVSVLFLLTGIGLYFFAELFFEKNITALIPLTSGIIFCQLLHDYYRKINFVKNEIVRAVVLDGVLYLGQLVAVGVLIFLEKIALREVLTCILVANLLSVIIGSWHIGINLTNTNYIKKLLIRHFHFSKWLLGTSVLQWLSGNYFIIVGASILGTAAIGAIRMVQNIMGLCHVMFLAMENIVPIEAARQYHLDGEIALRKYLISITWKLGLGFSFILAGVAFFAPQILNLLYGPESIQHAYIVLAYVVLYVFVFLGHPLRFFMRTVEKTQSIFVAYILGTLFSLLSANFLLDEYGMNGLLFGLIFTQVLAIATYLVFVKGYSKQDNVSKKNHPSNQTKNVNENNQKMETLK